MSSRFVVRGAGFGEGADVQGSSVGSAQLKTLAGCCASAVLQAVATAPAPAAIASAEGPDAATTTDPHAVVDPHAPGATVSDASVLGAEGTAGSGTSVATPVEGTPLLTPPADSYPSWAPAVTSPTSTLPLGDIVDGLTSLGVAGEAIASVIVHVQGTGVPA